MPDRKGLLKIISTRYLILVIKEINKYLVDMILVNSFRSGKARQTKPNQKISQPKDLKKQTVSIHQRKQNFEAINLYNYETTIKYQ
jgi:hypothetical protein